ncbi:MAG: hypothetical protein R3208_06920 [Ketobacteraceae bacterium]|nr:hypothetical protein [Ketobacteraceae bacterium]
MDVGVSESSRRYGGGSRRSLRQLLVQLSESKQFIWIFLLFVLITHIPTGKGGLLGDDFIQWAAATSPPALAEKGFHVADPDNSFIDRIKNSFLFMSADTTATAELKAYGGIPWWSPDDVTMHMFRPLSALTHWFDYNFLQGDVFLMQLHSVIYLLLLAASFYIFCRRFNCPGWVPALAVFLFVFSYSVPVNLNWLAARNALIAPMFALWAIIFHDRWRSEDHYGYLLMSLLALILALLSAEAGVATLAYLGAYALLLDPKRSLLNTWTILPAIGVVVAWRLFYSSQGFGTDNIDLYVDPVRSPLEFLTERVPILPVYYLRLIFGPAATLFLGITSSYLILSLISLVICSLAIWVIYPQLKESRIMQFGLLGSAVAIIPFLSTNPGPRMEPFLHIGFLMVVCTWLYELSRQAKTGRALKILVVVFLVLHLAIPTLLTIARHWRIVTLEILSTDVYSMVADDLKDGETNLVIVNSPAFSNYYHRPFGWAHQGLPLPKKIQMLVPGLNPVTIRREAENTYRLTSSEGFAVVSGTPRDLDSREDPYFNKPRVLAYRANNQIMTNDETSFSPGQKVVANGYEVVILHMEDSLPTEIRVIFTEEEPSVWQWFDWKEQVYKRMDMLEVGEKRFIPGPFDKT